MGEFRSVAGVLLAVPQFIGYLRAVLYAVGFAVVDVKAVDVAGIPIFGWQICLIFYTVAFVLDVMDGMVARALNQTSQLGGVLDMVLDRSATAALLTTLAGAYPQWRLYFAFLVALDVGSHWMHVASCQLQQGKVHHKAEETLQNRNLLLRLYYGIYPFFGYCCVGTEVFYILLLGLSYAPRAATTLPIPGQDPLTVTLSGFTWYACFPACVIKNIVNVMQLTSATVAIAELDVASSERKVT